MIQKGTVPGAGDDGGEFEFESPYTPPLDDFDQDDTYFSGEQQKGKGAKGGKGAAGAGSSLMTRSNRGAPRWFAFPAPARSTSPAPIAPAARILPRPIIDKVNIKTGKTTRIFAGAAPDMQETIDAVDGDDITVVFTTRQKKTVPPNSFMNDLKSGKVEKMTENVDHTPWFHKIETQRFQVTRDDGFKFWVKVTTAPDSKNKKLPAMFWIYP